MNNKLTMKEFLYAHVDNMIKLMDEGAHTFSAMRINCSACPFRELCHDDDDESGLSCEQFILNRLSDGDNYKAN